MENITYVNEKDEVIGAGSAKEAIANGIIHRVVRIFLRNMQGEVLIQKRSFQMRLFPGKWTQSAAGHVDEGETYTQAALRELHEELGVAGIPLVEAGKWYEEEKVGDQTKKQFYTLYAGEYDGEYQISPKEVAEIRWIDPKRLYAWMKERPEDFTPTCMDTFKRYAKFIGSSIGS